MCSYVDRIILALKLINFVVVGCLNCPLYVLMQEDALATLSGILALDMSKGYCQWLLSSRLAKFLAWVDAAGRVFEPIRLFLGLAWAPQ